MMPEHSIALLPAHEISPVEVLDACTAQVERHNPRLNAVVVFSGSPSRDGLVPR
jgi:Asp-tRNA(Asn)/Glu-tRNA(Gln) amidotransferase A subunit family amidase